MYKKILVPLDGSELAERTLGTAADLAEKLSASLLLVTVLSKSDETGVAGKARGQVSTGAGGAGTATVADSPAEVAEHYLKDKSEMIGLPNPVKTVVRFGDPASEIIAAAASEEAELIAMTTRGRSGVVRGLLGSVTDRVLRASPIPVMIARSDNSLPYGSRIDPIENVIVPLDGSQRAEVAIAHGQIMARAYGAKLHFIRVVSLLQVGYSSEMYAPVGNYDPYSREELEKDAAEYMERVTGRERGQSDEIASHVAYGNPRSHIVELATQLPHSLVVMTTRGHTGATRWVLGSTADGILRTAPAPTLLVRTAE